MIRGPGCLRHPAAPIDALSKIDITYILVVALYVYTPAHASIYSV